AGRVPGRVHVVAMARAPVGQQPQRAGQLARRGAELVYEARRAVRVALGQHEPLRLEVAQALGEDVRRDARKLALQVPKAPWAVEKRLDDQQGPAIPDASERLREGADARDL